MTTSKTFLRVRASLVVAGLASLLGGCLIEAKIGDDPMAGEDDGATDGGESTSTTAYPGYTSADGAGEDSATTGASPGSASATSTTGAPGEDSGGEDSASISASGTFPDVDPQTALDLCEVPVVPPGPDDPVIMESVLCNDGCLVEIETAVAVNLADEYGECLCEAMGCGPVVGGTSTSEGPVGDTESDSGDPDGCGEFPPGAASFTCTCEMCSIDVTDVFHEWLENDADLEAICECMCGGAGCGLPI